jgi:dihydroflavonol-4-reductase
MEGCEAGFHVAAWYEIGVTDRERMFRVNVGGTRHVLDAARETGLPKLVYCSTCGALGWHAPGELPDERYENPQELGSIYTESKYEAHRIVRATASEGLPVVTAMPGGVYGPGDPSMMGTLIEYTIRGWMLASLFDEAEFTFVHVDDVARGLYLAWERGRAGEEYVLGGDPLSVRDVVARVARAAGRRPPRFRIPTAVLRALAPVSGPMVRAFGFPPGLLRDAVTTMEAKSWAYSWDKAARELGYRPRPLAEGISQTVEWFREHRTPQASGSGGV